jgi:hypothetical protein
LDQAFFAGQILSTLPFAKQRRREVLKKNYSSNPKQLGALQLPLKAEQVSQYVRARHDAMKRFSELLKNYWQFITEMCFRK